MSKKSITIKLTPKEADMLLSACIEFEAGFAGNWKHSTHNAYAQKCFYSAQEKLGNALEGEIDE